MSYPNNNSMYSYDICNKTQRNCFGVVIRDSKATAEFLHTSNEIRYSTYLNFYSSRINLECEIFIAYGIIEE